jgi:hypothetical protein
MKRSVSISVVGVTNPLVEIRQKEIREKELQYKDLL